VLNSRPGRGQSVLGNRNRKIAVIQTSEDIHDLGNGMDDIENVTGTFRRSDFEKKKMIKCKMEIRLLRELEK
jgi:hypothetical protein